ncbi:hypothetical protein PIB30_072758 [Stylosanthes scabra]|uniref:Uncharacterized protein n=1 Tax=Stylosanthes scabra TaxID=79078 RepID=A0ABU6TQ14_9FABA|nr:hypothetical protein [Stylosanthes scabra]
MRKRDADISIEDIDELWAIMRSTLENFNLFENESGPTTPDSQAPPSSVLSVPSVSNATSTKGKSQKTQMTIDFSQDLKDITMAVKDIANAIVSTSAEVWKICEIRPCKVGHFFELWNCLLPIAWNG